MTCVITAFSCSRTFFLLILPPHSSLLSPALFLRASFLPFSFCFHVTCILLASAPHPRPDLATWPLGIYSKYSKSFPRDTHTTMFIAALFAIAKKWSQAVLPVTFLASVGFPGLEGSKWKSSIGDGGHADSRWAWWQWMGDIWGQYYWWNKTYLGLTRNPRKTLNSFNSEVCIRIDRQIYI